MKFLSDKSVWNESGVYKIVNSVDKKIYVGSALKFRDRFRKHANSLKNGTHYNKHLQFAFNKYGAEAFTFEVVKITVSADRKKEEQFYIKKLNSMDDRIGYNLKYDTGNETILSEEVRNKLRESGKKLGKLSAERFKDPIYKQNFAEHMRSIPKSESHIQVIKENGLKYNKKTQAFKTELEISSLMKDYIFGLSMLKLSEKYSVSTSGISRIFIKPYPVLYKDFLVKIGFEGNSIKDLRKPEVQAKLTLTQD